MVEGSQGLSLVVLRERSAQTVVPLVPLSTGAVSTGLVSHSAVALLDTLSLAVSAQLPLGLSLAQCPSPSLPKELRATQEEAGGNSQCPLDVALPLHWSFPQHRKSRAERKHHFGLQ